MLQGFKLWGRHGILAPRAAPLGASFDCRLPGLRHNRRAIVVGPFSSRGSSALHFRSFGLLRREAQARLDGQKDSKSCILLSPENKITERMPMYDSLFPCQQYKSPRIEHLLCLEDGTVVDVVSAALDLPKKYVEELIYFGAVYVALVCPTPPKGSLSASQRELYQKFSALSRDKKRASLKGKTIVEAQKTMRVANIWEGVEAGSYLRVHVHLKRFPRCYEADWKSRVIAETDSYLILDKPAGVPVGSAVDNTFECCAVFAARAVGLGSPLKLTHQLDNCTEGCVVLAKTKEFASAFHFLLKNKEVQKYYLVLATGPVPLGKMTHYMRPAARHPRIVSPVPRTGWARCELEVIECKQVAWPTSEVEKKYCINDSEWQAKNFAYECKVELLTGRTHQVRAQFAALNAPLIGDSMYMPAVISRLRCPEVYPFSLDSGNLKDGIEEDELDIEEAALEKWVAGHGPEPEYAIGLQASEISWDNGACHFRAQEPWWRQ